MGTHTSGDGVEPTAASQAAGVGPELRGSEELVPPPPGLSREETRREWAVATVAGIVGDRIRDAAIVALDRRLAGESARTYDVLKEAWARHDYVLGASAFLPITQVPAEIAQEPIRFYPGIGEEGIAQCCRSAITGAYTGISIYLGRFDGVKSREELLELSRRFEEASWHEAEHIFHAGADYDPDPDASQDEKKLALAEYLTCPGEIRAHAREFAVAFFRQFPGEEFDSEKFMALETNWVAQWYLKGFAAANHQAHFAQYDHLPPVAEVHRELVGLAEHFTRLFNHRERPYLQEWRGRQAEVAALLGAELPAFVAAGRDGVLAHADAVVRGATGRELGLTFGEVDSYLRYANQIPPHAGKLQPYFIEHGDAMRLRDS